mmetsp:Transcript_19252/g.32805  ORF Transcript_19252/g.32805 Transcript_19252/m.32805 type:complete len:232 (+) Transcript_19252:801-1496(+)
MAHLCRVLPKEQTIRMHYANCNTYNADFDGDEMNVHLPQSYQAHSEAYSLMATHKQYCVPTSGKPIRGLIQDSVVSGVFLTSKDTFIDKEKYNQLVYVGLRELIETDKIGKIITLPPAILKPKPLWTGKQIISLVIPLVSLKRKGGSDWDCHKDSNVLISNGELICGVMNKGIVGSSGGGLVHIVWRDIGPYACRDFMSNLQNIVNNWLQGNGFTVGVQDMIAGEETTKKI